MRGITHKFAILVTTVLLLLMVGTGVYALAATITVDNNAPAVGESVSMSVTLTGSTSADPPRFQKTPGLEIVYQGPATSVQIINGKMSSSVVFNYSVVATKKGTFTLGPVILNSKRKKVSTNSIRLTVSDAPPQPAQTQAENGQGNGSTSNSLQRRLFLKADLPKTTFYAGESVQTTIRLYVNGVTVQDVGFPEISSSDCQIEIGKPHQISETNNGIPYKVLEFPTTLHFVKTGKFHLGPVRLQCNLVVENEESDPFFSGFFDNNEVRPQVLAAEAWNVSVLPLPSPPQGFSGGIGRYALKAAVSPKQVLEGDPVTVTLTLTGVGNFSAVAPPVLQNRTGFKVYDAQRKNIKGVAVPKQIQFEQILFPLSDRITSVGPFTLTYFDSAQGRYQTITTPVFPIRVKHNPNFNRSVGINPTGAPANELGHDLVYIKDTPGRWQRKSSEIYRRPWFWLLQLLPFCAIGAALGFRRYREFLQSDAPSSRGMRARRQAEQRLTEAKSLLSQGNYSGFLDELHRIFREYLAEKFQLPAGGITKEVTSHLREHGVDEALCGQIERFFETYDQYRFTGTVITEENATRLLEDVTRILTAFERQKPTKGISKGRNFA